MKVHFDEIVILILNSALEEARQSNHVYLTPEHVLFSALQFHPVQGVFELLSIDSVTMEEEVTRYLSYVDKTEDQPKRSSGFEKLLEFAYYQMQQAHGTNVSLQNMLCALIEIEETQCTRFFRGRNITKEKIIDIMERDSFESYLKKKHDDDIVNTYEMKDDPDSGESGFEDFFPNMYGVSAPEDDATVLKKYTINLNEKAKKHTFDIFVGQEYVIQNVFEVLIRRKKNNVMLVGDPGVGKTALVREIARRIAFEKAPKALNAYEVLELNVVALVAGTRYRGDFEDRVRRLIEVISERSCILFVDEFQTILGAGASSANSSDFSDLIKPLLTESSIRFIGIVTHEEYKNIEHERPLLRRFHVVDVPEPGKQDTFKILQCLKPAYESFYTMKYSNDVLYSVIHLSDDFLSERRFPDKAIDVLDSVGAMVTMQAFSQEKKKARVITEKHIEELISKMTKQPVSTISANEFTRLMNAERNLNRRVFGQEHAVQAVLKAVRRSKTGVTERVKPLMSVLFVGPTGVGKTELSKQLADELGMYFHRFDMSEYQEKAFSFKIYRFPPGYVGFEHGSVFVDKVRRDPYSVVLLDEIEKAHADIFNLLLQIMDYGVITDSGGRQADFRNTIIIMTSNAGAQESSKAEIGFDYALHKGNSEITQAVTHLFSPEFRNRLDDTIVFHPLTEKHVRAIVRKELISIKETLSKKRLMLTWTAGVITHLATIGYSALFGARNIIRTIDTHVRDIISEHVVRLLSSRKNSALRVADGDIQSPYLAHLQLILSPRIDESNHSITVKIVYDIEKTNVKIPASELVK